MRADEFERKESLARFTYAAEILLRTVNMYYGTWYRLRSAGPVLRDEQQISHQELRAALDYLQERGYIDVRMVKDRAKAKITDHPLEELECKLMPDGLAVLAGEINDPLVKP